MRSRLVPPSDLGPDIRDRMFDLLTAHFEGVEREPFESDLSWKNWVLLLEEGGTLRGFSTLLVNESNYRGEKLSVVYSGDTIMERGSWWTPALPRSWIAAVLSLHEGRGAGRLYWLLLASGFRTYRFLPVFWRDFHPRPGTPIPGAARALRDRLAAERLGPAYDPGSGIARFERPQVLRRGLDEIPPGRLADPHVAFFLERNPGWRRGDELVCLAEIAWDNLTPAGRRFWRLAARTPVLAEARA